MADPKPQLDTENRYTTEEVREALRETEYRAVMGEIIEGASKLEQVVRGSNYEKLPGNDALNPLLFKITKADTLLPEGHPLREQFDIQEKAALEIIENIKNSRKYLDALKDAEKNAEELKITLEGKEGVADMLRGSEDQEIKLRAREHFEDELTRQFEAFEKPLFHTLPENHPLRKKNVAREKKIKEIVFGELKERTEAGSEVVDPEGEERKRRLAETQQDVGDFRIPKELEYPPAPGTFNPREKLVPQELTEEGNARLEAYQQSMRTIEQEIEKLETSLPGAAKNRDTDAIETGLGQVESLSLDLARLETPLGTDPAKAKALRERLADLKDYGNGQSHNMEREKKEKVIANATWMPRVPSPPYRARFANAPVRKMATLTAAPATVSAAPTPEVNVQARPLPAVPPGIADKSEDEKLAYLEELLLVFQAEHKRLVDEHNDLVRRLTEQVKERKLQALRDSLK